MTTATQQPPDNRIATRPFESAVLEKFSGASSRDPREITRRIREAMETANFIGPMTQCPTLPDGCEVAFTTVMADTDLDHKEIYKQGDGYALHKVVLNKIKMAVGVEWDKTASGRLDDGSQPHFCHYKAYGYVRKYDGTFDTIEGDEALDLREGSALVEEIRLLKIDKALTKLEQTLKRAATTEERNAETILATRFADADIRKKRIKILRLTQTSAQNAAIRSMGIRHTYSMEELQEKPFVIATLMFTGRSDNPAQAARFSEMIGEHFLGSRSKLYARSEPAQLTNGSAGGYQPPPVESHAAPAEDDHTDLTNVIDADETGDEDLTEAAAKLEAKDATATTETKPASANETGQQTLPTAESTATGTATPAPVEPEADFEIKFGRDKGKKVSELKLSSLSSLFDFYNKTIDAPEKARYRAANEAAMSTIMAWIDYRRALGEDKPKQAKIY